MRPTLDRVTFLFTNDGLLWAAPFSLERLERTGDAFLVADNAGPPTVSRGGTLVAPSRSRSLPMWRQLTIRDRDGARLGTVGPPLYFAENPALSPDGRQVAVSAADREGASNDIWLFDVGRGIGRRLVSDRLIADQPAWRPNGRELLFRKQNDNDRNADYFIVDVASGKPARPFLITELREAEPDWSPDGATLIYQSERQSETEFDLRYRVRSPDGELGEPVSFVETEFNEVHAQFSPDGRFVAYASRESGAPQIYVRSFPDGRPVWKISERGGSSPRWSPDGSELYWAGQDAAGRPVSTLMAARMNLGSDSPVGEIRVLFESEMIPTGTFMYDVMPDGRFVMVEPSDEVDEPPPAQYIHVIENWMQLERSGAEN